MIRHSEHVGREGDKSAQGRRPCLSAGSLLFDSGTDRTWSTFRNVAYGGTNMNQNAKRNLQRRKRQATRLSKREYFRKKKEAINVSAPGKDKVG